MLTHEFSVEDLALTRFAISPMWELVSAVRTLHDPARGAHHLPWIREALPIARELGIERALALTPPTGYMPDFLTPPPSSPIVSFAAEMALVRETPAAQVRKEVAIMIRDRASSAGGPVAEAFVEHPRRELVRLCDGLEAFWEAAVETHWPRVRAVLEADVRHRSGRLAEGGPALLFADLDPRVEWKPPMLEIEMVYENSIPLEGRGLVIMPSAFESTRPVSISNAPWQPTLIYPTRGIALLWEPGSDAGPDELAALIGRTRADMLVSLASARTTTELAELLGLRAGGISHHLGVLARVGLVSRARSGRSVLYLRTPLAERLLSGEDRAP